MNPVRSAATLDNDLELGEYVEPLRAARQPAEADPRIWGNQAIVVLTPVRQNATETPWVPTPPWVRRQPAFGGHSPQRDRLNNELNSIYVQQ